MANYPATNDYTNRDYESLLASLLDQAALKLPEWTDRSENDLGRMLLESFAYVGDVLLYYQDRIANEAFLSTAVERRSVIDLLSLIGYTLATPAPATAELTIEVPNDSTEVIKVEVGAKFATQASPGQPAIEFIFLPADNRPLEFSRNGTGGTRVYPDPKQVPPESKLIVIQAKQVPENLDQYEHLGQSSGEANQSFRLRQNPVLLSRDPDQETYLTVEVDSGSGFEQWHRQDTLLHSRSTSKHFLVKVNESDEADIIFGDGKYGQIPRFGSVIRASYLTGGGTAGNVGRNAITQVVNSGVKTALGGTLGSLKVRNPRAASGGADRESIAQARQQAPSVYRSQQRAVTAADYVALAENFPGVAKATVDVPGWNYVDLYVVAEGNQPLTDDLRARLSQYFDNKRMVTTLVNVRQPDFVAIDVKVKELGIEPTYYVEDVQRLVESEIASLFEIDHLEFGQPFYLSKVYEAIENVPGVDFAQEVELKRRLLNGDNPESNDANKGSTGKIQLHPRQFPQQGDLSLQKITGGLR